MDLQIAAQRILPALQERAAAAADWAATQPLAAAGVLALLVSRQVSPRTSSRFLEKLP